MEKYRVGVIGGTGMVGQRFVTLLENHPWFQLTAIAASSRSAGKTYEEAIGGRWALDVPMPGEAKDMVVLNAETDIDRIAAQVDFVFSAVDMKKEEIQALEEAYARRGCPVVSNNSAHRWTPDVPRTLREELKTALELEGPVVIDITTAETEACKFTDDPKAVAYIRESAEQKKRK